LDNLLGAQIDSSTGRCNFMGSFPSKDPEDFFDVVFWY